MSEAITGATLIERLSERFSGSLFRGGEPEYDLARSVYNGSIDRRPALVARPRGTADVIEAVKEARVAGLPIAVRGGGHSVAGNGTCDGGLLLDLSLLKGVHVDPRNRIARAGGGVLWGEFDRETGVFGLATPGGRVTTTGVAGFATGGGYGWLSPKLGLTCDNILSATVVTADGTVVVASEHENEDLLFGIRGGSSNFGVVTSFEFRLHPVGPILYGGLVGYSIDRASDVLRAWRDFAEAAPDELGTGAVLLVAPPEEFVPESLHHQPVLGIFALWVGSVDEGEHALRPFRDANTPDFDLMGATPYSGLQAMIDPFAPPGWHNYHRGLHLSGLPDEAIDAFITTRPQNMPPMTQAIIFRHGGAVGRVPAGTTATSHRDAAYMFHPIACWQDPAETDRYLQWVYASSDAMQPFTTGGVYLNFTGDEGPDKVRAGYDAETWARLVALKDKYDPDNVFRFNQNIPPSAQTAD
jgi:FAD/FMN-containing dehydrogenase